MALHKPTSDESMAEINTKLQAAFPYQMNGVQWTGMSKRELFAAMAMQGMMGLGWSPSLVASESVKHADALIAELANGSAE